MYISGSVSVCCMFFAVCCLILPLHVSKVTNACYWWTEPLSYHLLFKALSIYSRARSTWLLCTRPQLGQQEQETGVGMEARRNGAVI